MRTFTRWMLYIGAILCLLAASVIASPQWGMLPHRVCLRGDSVLTWAYVVTNTVVALAYFLIGVVLYTLARSIPQIFFSPRVVDAFALFIVACGMTHVMDIVTVWWPAYYAQLVVLMLCAAASVITVVAIFQLEPAIERFLESRRGEG